MKNSQRALAFIDKIPMLPLTAVALFMAMAPFSPEPHLVEKTRMLADGTLSKPIDIFDLFWHSFLIVLLLVRVVRARTFR